MAERTSYQRFETMTLKRSQIHEAVYNPRIMDAFTATRLRENLRRVGLIDLPIVNKRFDMRLVAGHQRVHQLDILEKNADYDLQVAVVDLDERAEREFNILLNNPAAQGDWDLEKLAQLLPEINAEKAGLSKFDIGMLFEDSEHSPAFAETPTQAAVVGKSAAVYEQERKTAMQKRRDKQWGGSPLDDGEYFLVVQFEREEERDELFALLNIDPSGTIDGRLLEAELPPDE